MVRKGLSKRRITQFKKGHTPHKRVSNGSENYMDKKCNKFVKRFNRNDFEKFVKLSPDGLQYTIDGDITQRILRPSQIQSKSLCETYALESRSVDEMRLLSNNKVSDMYNLCYNEHKMKSGTCLNPNLLVNKEIKRGLAWRQSLKCVNCSYKSDVFKLYNEVSSTPKPGPKPAAPNYGLQVALQDMPIGNTKARLLFAGINTPPPARSSMQKLSNAISEKTIELNTNDMEERVCKLKEIKSKTSNKTLNVSIDCRYNTNSVTSRKKMGQSASQSVAFSVENASNSKDIIGVYTANKLCWTGAWLKNKGYDITCPGHADCSANYSQVAPFSEFEAGKELGKQAIAQRIVISHVTTDGDGRSADGVAESFSLVSPLLTVTRQDDPTHLGQTQFRRCLKAVFSPNMFGDERTLSAEEKKIRHKLFSLDIKSRWHCVFEKLFSLYNGNVTAISKCLCR